MKLLVHLLTSLHGTFEPSTDACSMAVFGGDPDISQRPSRGPSLTLSGPRPTENPAAAVSSRALGMLSFS